MQAEIKLPSSIVLLLSVPNLVLDLMFKTVSKTVFASHYNARHALPLPPRCVGWVVPMLHFRGMEAGCALAQAYVHHKQSPMGRLPG